MEPYRYESISFILIIKFTKDKSDTTEIICIRVYRLKRAPSLSCGDLKSSLKSLPVIGTDLEELEIRIRWVAGTVV